MPKSLAKQRPRRERSTKRAPDTTLDADFDLFRALVDDIVAGDAVAARKRVAENPRLVTYASPRGATRQDSERFFIDTIRRHLSEGDTALHIAAAAYRHAIVKWLLSRGADVCAANRLGADALNAALAGGPTFSGYNGAAQAKTIALLVAAGADPNRKGPRGVTALHTAVRNRSAAAVQTLLTAGANPRAKNDNGSTPLHLAVQTTGRGGTGSDTAKAEQRKIIELLLEHGAKPSDKDAKGKTVTSLVAGTPLAAFFA